MALHDLGLAFIFVGEASLMPSPHVYYPCPREERSGLGLREADLSVCCCNICSYCHLPEAIKTALRLTLTRNRVLDPDESTVTK